MSGSSSYWKKREQEEETARQKYIEDEVAYQKEIDEIYASQIKSINDQIYAFYAAYASKEGLTMAETKKAVSNLDIKEYAKKAKKYVAEKDFSDQANEEMRIYNLTMKVNRLELLKANIGLELVSSTNELQKYFDQILTSRTLEEFERQAGILGITVQDNSKFAETIVDASFHNATWSDRIWANQEYLKAELNKTLSNGLIQGLNPRALASSIAKSCGVSKKNALRLMRTELARVQTQAQVEAYNRNGFDEYIFLAERTACTECLAINGKVFKVADAEAGDNLPPIHPNCRCSTAAYIDEKAYNQWLDAKANGETSASFEEWKQSNDSKRKIATGARILDPNSESASEWAKNYYEEIRHKSTDCKKISERTGIPLNKVKKIKEYVFNNKDYVDPFTGETGFSPDAAMAQSWQRLAEGKEILPHDLTMLNHELLEMEIKEKNPNISHDDAHQQASLVYNYAKEVDDYYGARQKRKS